MYFKCFDSPEMEFFRLKSTFGIIFANSLTSSSFYKSKAKIETDKLKPVT